MSASAQPRTASRPILQIAAVILAVVLAVDVVALVTGRNDGTASAPPTVSSSAEPRPAGPSHRGYRDVSGRANVALQRVIPALAGVRSTAYEASTRSFVVYFDPRATSAQRRVVLAEIRQLILRSRGAGTR